MTDEWDRPTAGGGHEHGDSGTSVLLLDPSGDVVSGEHCEAALTPADPARENVLFVTYDREVSPDDLWDRWDAAIGTPPAELGIIAIGDETRSSAARSASSRPAGPDPGHAGPVITTIADPTDLTALGTAIVTYLDGWEANDDRTVVCFNSITTLLEHVGVETAFGFLYTLTGYIDRNGATAHFHLDQTVHHAETVEVLRDVFDRTVDTGDADPTEGPSLPRDAVDDVLSASRRRILLEQLLGEAGSIDVRTLAERIAAREADVPPDSVPGEKVEAVHVALHHLHLPKLDQRGIVAVYDEESRVELLERGRQLRPHLESVDDDPTGSPA